MGILNYSISTWGLVVFFVISTNYSLSQEDSISVSKQIYDLEQVVNNPDEGLDYDAYVQANFDLVNLYTSISLYTPALKKLKKLEEEFITPHDYTNIVFIELRIAKIWTDLDRKENAKINYLKAYKYLADVEPELAAGIHNGIANYFEINEEIDSAEYHYGKALEISQSSENPDSIWYKIAIYSNRSRMFINDFDNNKITASLKKALSILNEVEQILSQVPEQETHANIFLQFGEVYRYLKDYKLSERYLKKCNELSERLNSVRFSLQAKKELSGLYSIIERPDKAYKYLLEYSNLKEKHIEIDKEFSLNEMENLFDIKDKSHELDLKQKELDKKILRKKYDKAYNVGLIVILSLIVLLAVVLVFRFKERARKNKELLVIEHELRRSEKVNMQNDIRLKEVDITNLVLDINQRSEFSRMLLVEMNKVKNRNNLQKSDISELIVFVKSFTMSEKGRLIIQNKIDEVNSAFEDRLRKRFPDLSKGELNLCKYARLGLSLKDVSILKGVDEASVKQGRYRLRKKLRISTEISLNQFMQSI